MLSDHFPANLLWFTWDSKLFLKCNVGFGKIYIDTQPSKKKYIYACFWLQHYGNWDFKTFQPVLDLHQKKSIFKFSTTSALSFIKINLERMLITLVFPAIYFSGRVECHLNFFRVLCARLVL